MRRVMPKKLKRILGEPTNPPSSKRYCLYCKDMRKFKFDRMIGHSACVECGSHFSKRLAPIKKEVKNE